MMTDSTRTRQGTVVIEPEAQHPPATVAMPPLPAAPEPAPAAASPTVALAPPAAPVHGPPPHPLAGTLPVPVAVQVTTGLQVAPARRGASGDHAPATQAVPLRLRGPVVPFERGGPAGSPDGDRSTALPGGRTPWEEVRDGVRPAGHAHSVTLVEQLPAVPRQAPPPPLAIASHSLPDSEPPPPTELAPSPMPSPVPARRGLIEPAAPDVDPGPLALPDDPWGSALNEVEPPLPPPAPRSEAPRPAPKVEVRKGIYAKFGKR